MPNARVKNKVFGGFFGRRLKTVVTKAAAEACMKDNVFGFAMAPITPRIRLGLRG